MINAPPTLPITIADLERLADKLALTQNNENEEISRINDKRIMYRFWLREDVESELALMQWLDILKANRKMQTFIKLALRLAILETKGYTDKSDDICDAIEGIFDDKVDWTRE